MAAGGARATENHAGPLDEDARERARSSLSRKPPSDCSAAVIYRGCLYFEPPKTSVEYEAVGLRPYSVLKTVQYDNTPPYPFLCGQLSRTADCVLGGVNSDVSEAVVVNLIRELTRDEVRVAAVDMFHHPHGMCRLWLDHGRRDVDTIRGLMHGRVWMGSLLQHCALIAREERGERVLNDFLSEHAAVLHAACPTHTMTVQDWEERS